MTEIIPNMKKHTCPTCGGQLTINEVRQMYECPFCGVSFDYEYFREDDVLDRAARALRAGEYVSARDAYDFMLQKEPHNFIALRGKILVAANAKSMREFQQPNRLRNTGFERVDPQVDAAIEQAKPEHKAYFTKLQELFQIGKEYKEAIRKIDKSRKAGRQNGKEIQRISRASREPYVEMRDPWEANETMSVHPKSVIAGAVGVFVVWCILVGFLGYAISRNPYAKDSTTTTTTIRVISYQRSNGVFIAGEGYVSFDPSLYDSYDEYMSSVEQMQQEESKKEVQAVESKRKENEEKYKKQHKDDWQMLLALVLVPGFVIALICFFMIKRISRIRELEEEIDRIKEKNDRIEEETHAYETDAASIRKKINEVYKELASLDPFPEVQNAPIRGRTQLSSRWKV
ncbi:MAG: hypothetical protein IK020_13140 [Clostridiales bacterium]|nr:hypothetical protein [Clostridiales bacterium]